MYKDYYHLNAEPFGSHPSTDTFFVSNTHKDAWYYLLFGIETQEPFLVLTGEYGMGKTLLCLRLIKTLKGKEKLRVEYIPTTNEGYGGILRRIATNMGISPLPEDEEILQDMIYDRFRADEEKTPFYLIIDDAHELDSTVLAKLKHLSTFSHDEFFPMIMVFVGHPTFLQDLKTPALSSLNQRIKRRYHLARFDLEDTKNYIYFRLLKSGATGIPAFPDETIRRIFQYSGGVPRLINNICDTCLLVGASNHLATIPPSIVDEAKNMVDGSLSEREEEESCIEEDVFVEEETEAPAEFTAELPETDAPVQEQIFSIRADLEQKQPEKAPSAISLGAGKGKKMAAMAVAAILLLLLGALLSQLIMDYKNRLTFSPPVGMTSPQYTPVQPENTVPEIPTLREEQTALQATLQSNVQSTVQSGLHPFSLRSASYQQLDGALKEVAEIKQLGLLPYIVKADYGDMGNLWRVYIGFYSTEEEAKQTKARYNLINTAVQKTQYACQVGEFSNGTDGLAMFDKLKKSGHFPYVVQKDRNVFRMYLGAFEGKAEAEGLQQRLQREGISGQVVLR